MVEFTSLEKEDLFLFKTKLISEDTLRFYDIQRVLESNPSAYSFSENGMNTYYIPSRQNNQFEFMGNSSDFKMFGFEKLPAKSTKPLYVVNTPLEVLQYHSNGQLAIFAKRKNPYYLEFIKDLESKFNLIIKN